MEEICWPFQGWAVLCQHWPCGASLWSASVASPNWSGLVYLLWVHPVMRFLFEVR